MVRKVKGILASCVAAGMIFSAGAVQAAELKIALVETLSGPQASTGRSFRAGLRYSIDKFNDAGGWHGETVELMEYDNQGGPVGASEKVKAAIAQGAKLIFQGASSAVGGQITEDVRKHNLRNPGKEVVYLNIGAEALSLTGKKCHFHHFRFNPNANVRVKALVDVMKSDGALGKEVYSINQNYSWGQDMQAAIEANAKVQGYNVANKVLHDTSKIQDFSPYVAKIQAAKVDSVITGNWSNDLLLLMKAAKDVGLNVPFGTAFLDQPGNIANAGPTAIGHYIANAFNPQLNKEAEAFAEEYKSKMGHYPTFAVPQTVFAFDMVAAALRNTPKTDDGFIVNTFARVLENTSVETPMGVAQMRAEDHQNILPIVVSKVTKTAKYKADNSELGFEPVKKVAGPDAASPVQASCKMKRPN